ncbi:MAG: glycosyltransferase [Cetobacterium sp.]
MDKKILSIIIPVYNVQEYIEECLESALNQNVENYEIICVNDGSTDDSLKILQRYSETHKKIKVIDQKNKGLSGARNTGFNSSTGKFIMFLDSDDYLKENSLKELIRKISEENLEILAYNYINYYKVNNQKIEDRKISVDKFMTGIEYYKEMSVDKSCPMSWLNIYKREFLEKNDLYFLEGIVHEDVEFMVRLLPKVEKMKYMNEAIYYYRRREGSIMTEDKYNPNKKYSFEKIIETCEKELLKTKDLKLKTIIESRISASTFSILKEELKEKVLRKNEKRLTLSYLEKKRTIINKTSSKKLKLVSNSSITFFSLIFILLMEYKFKKMIIK